MTFGEQLTRIRKQKGMTQEQLAEALGITRQGISNWERNRTLPDIEAVKQLSLILEFDFAAFQRSESANPEAKSKRPFPTAVLLSFIVGVLAALLVMLVIVSVFNKPESAGYITQGIPSTTTGPETVQWFSEKGIPVSGKPYIAVTFSENPLHAVKDPAFPNGYGWNFTVYLTECNGLDFYPETFTKYLFRDERHSFSYEYSQEKLTKWWGEAKIPARGQQCVGVGDPLQELIGIGIKLTGRDANGEYMEFRGYIELLQDIKE